MLESVMLLSLLGISIALYLVNKRILAVTEEMLEVTIRLHITTEKVLKSTQKTYEILSGEEEDLTKTLRHEKIIQMDESKEINGG